MYTDYIFLDIYYIKGIINRQLIVQGAIIENNEFEFKIYYDDIEQPVNMNYHTDSGQFEIEQSVGKTVKMVKLILILDEKELLLFELKAGIFISFIKKVIKRIVRFFKKIKKLFILLGKGFKFLWKQHKFLVPPKFWPKYFQSFIKLLRRSVIFDYYISSDPSDYNKWLKENESEPKIYNFDYRPLISVLIPVYNVKSRYLADCLDSILAQNYDNWEICLVDDKSTNQETLDTITEYAQKDKRIKVKFRTENGHISRATNDALDMANGEFIALVDNDDILTVDALSEVVNVINTHQDIDLIYSDEDKINLKGERTDPHFKPDFSPDTLMSLNYITHLSVLRTSLVREIDGFTVGLEGAQDYDLLLRFTEKTSKIFHIPKVLYHWRIIPGSTSMEIDNKSYVVEAGIQTLQNALDRRGLKAKIVESKVKTLYRVEYDVSDEPLVSIIMPIRDQWKITSQCLESIYEKSSYKNFEIIIANNGSQEKQTYDLLNEYKKNHDNFKVVDIDIPFNYSKINNEAVKFAQGDYLILLNNDIKVLSSNWIEIMVGYAKLEHVGAVGAKLLYPDLKVQHGGVILGMGGVACHAFIDSVRNDIGHYGRLIVPYDFGAVTAACLAIKKSKFHEVGGLNEELAIAFNDIDFCVKLLDKGYYNLLAPQVELIHYESKSRGYDTTGEKYERFKIEHKYMREKWGDKIKYDPFYNINYSRTFWYLLDKKKIH